MILLLVTVLRQGQETPAEISFTEFLSKLEADQIETVTMEEGFVQQLLRKVLLYRI